MSVPPQQELQARRVECAHVAQIEQKPREADRPQLAQLALDDGRRFDVELADRTNADRAAFGLDLAAERLER